MSDDPTSWKSLAKIVGAAIVIGVLVGLAVVIFLNAIGVET